MTRHRISTVVLVVIAWLWVVVRAIPTQIGDRGIFVSVAERLASGDRLYVDVWDNKDPFFYLTLGAGRLVSPYLDVVIELGWILAAGLASVAIARRVGISTSMAVLVGLGMVPVIITGSEYLAGFTHLPATALCLAIVAALLSDRFVLVGFLTAALVMFKLIALPIAVVVVAVVLWRRRSLAPLVPAIAGFAVTWLAGLLLLLLRGELLAYLNSLVLNVEYSQSLQDRSNALPLAGLLGKVMTTAATATALASVTVLAVAWLARSTGAGQEPTSPRTTLWWMSLATVVTAFAVTAVTGLWPHHSQLLYLPAALCAILLAASFADLGRLTAASGVVLVGTALLLAGAPSPQLATDSALSAPTRLRALDDIAPWTADLRAAAPSGDYARVGLNDELGHALGLRDWSLACPKFHQYEYDPLSTFSAVTDCIPGAQWLLVDDSLAPQDGYPEWNAYVATVEDVLRADFTCQTRDWGRLCRNGAAS